MGILRLRSVQVKRLELDGYERLSLMLKKCCLRLSANESYQSAEREVEAQMRVKVNHSRLQRLSPTDGGGSPSARQKVSQVSVDGGKVRLRTPIKGQPCNWLEDKSARVEGLYYGATISSKLGSARLAQYSAFMCPGRVFRGLGMMESRMSLSA